MSDLEFVKDHCLAEARERHAHPPPWSKSTSVAYVYRKVSILFQLFFLSWLVLLLVLEEIE